jgi:hypothetical protein
VATYIHETASEPFPAETRNGAFWRREPSSEKLKAGDTLVVSSLGSLGESYAEICESMRDLMQRRVFVRAISEGLTFDGTAEDVGARASRDALIGFAAAAAESKKTARDRAAGKTRHFYDPEPVNNARPIGVRLGVIGAQLTAIALAAYLIGVWLPGLHRRAPPPRSVALEDSQISSQPAEPPRYSTRDFLFEKESSASGVKADLDANPAGDQSQLLGDKDADTASNVPAQQPLGLSRERVVRIFYAVGHWRSARVKNTMFPIAVGSVAPPDVHLAIFPRGLVRGEPALRGYKFIIGDQLIGVVDPASRRIVAILNGIDTNRQSASSSRNQ